MRIPIPPAKWPPPTSRTDAAGRQEFVTTDRDGDADEDDRTTLQYFYDELGRVARTVYPRASANDAATEVTTTYDAQGRRAARPT